MQPFSQSFISIQSDLVRNNRGSISYCRSLNSSMFNNFHSKDHKQQVFYKQKPYKLNVNRLFYQEFTTKNALQNLYKLSHHQLLKIMIALEKTQKYYEKVTQCFEGQYKDQQFPYEYLKFHQGVHEPQICMLIKKYKSFLIQPNLLNYVFSQENKHQQKQNLNLSEQIYNFEGKKSIQQFLLLKKNFSESKKNDTMMNNIIFNKIANQIAQQVDYIVYIPSTIKVIMNGINWIDKENNSASIGLKVQIKIHIPGFNNYPNVFQSWLKNKFQISLKTDNHSTLHNSKASFKNIRKQNIQISKGNDLFNDKVNIQLTSDPLQLFKQKYKWKNYYRSDDYIFKKIRQFQGCIFLYQLNDVRVYLSKVDKNSPLQLIDLKGIIQIQPIITTMKQWSTILFNQQQSEFRKFLQQVSPKLTVKFNLISLYQDQNQIEPTKRLLFNHIYSFDYVQKDDYQLAQRLMLLQISNNRISKYELIRPNLNGSYKWKRLPEQELKPIKFLKYLHRKRYQLHTNQKLIIRGQYRYLLKRKFKRLQQLQKINFQLKKIKSFSMYPKDNFSQQKLLKQINFFILDLNIELKQISKDELFLQIHLKQLQKLENNLYHLQKIIGNVLENGSLYTTDSCNLQNIHYSQRYLQFTMYYIQKLRIQIKKTTEQLLEQLLIIKLTMSKSQQRYLNNFSSPLEKNALKLLKKQIKQVKQYLSDELMDRSYKYDIKQKKFDDDYNQSKAIYHFPLYKSPGRVLWIIFSSISVLCFINLAIFFQSPSLEGRIASVTSLMLFFAGMIAIVQKQMRFLIIQKLFYLLFFTPLICLFHSFFLPPKTKINQVIDIALNSIEFYICFIITIGSIGYISYYYYIFIYFQKREYNLNLRIMKQTEATYLMLPGSREVDRILALDNPLIQKKIYHHKNKKFQEKNQNAPIKKLQRIVFTIMIRHINNLFEIRQRLKNQQIDELHNMKYKDLGKYLQERVKSGGKIIKSMFQFPQNQQTQVENRKNV